MSYRVLLVAYTCARMSIISRFLMCPSYVITDGPGLPSIYGPSFAEKGHSVTFNCSASSQPPSHFSWFFNGSLVANTSEFETGQLTFDMSGEYTCMAHNNVTKKNSTSSKMLTVMGKTFASRGTELLQFFAGFRLSQVTEPKVTRWP